ncbi:DUF4136 domain-containing protein [Flagellimonas myxillae]|uniref:DUF4136 domain-containing protein n=1 Tax=Flagellimonas myxillae TaxID=2942214 RepID=UPI00201F33F9|nr:DUF4136 domain-containing protein [Muricauda myxillae]MCL6264901.1 DUF4136 domain-containing protein [Muricauda myxillae]
MKYLFSIIILGLLASCGGIRVNYDYDKATNFRNYSSYNYFSDMDSGLSQLDEQRLLRVLDSTLQSKGFLLTEEPCFYINILSSEFRSSPNNAVGVGIGGTGRNVGGGVSVGLPLGNSGIQRRIQFDFVDAQKDALFWQATTESGYRENASPSVREERLRALVKKVFSKFPPQ